MQRVISQSILLLLLAAVLAGGFFLVRGALHLPFRAANDALHREEAPLTLDFLIPAGIHIDEHMTIGEVIRLRFKKEKGLYDKAFQALSQTIPLKYRYIAALALFTFWFLCYMTFLRVFTLMGYARALRGSLVLAGITYYFMPDLLGGKADDILFLGVPLLIVLLRWYLVRRKKRKRLLRA